MVKKSGVFLTLIAVCCILIFQNCSEPLQQGSEIQKQTVIDPDPDPTQTPLSIPVEGNPTNISTCAGSPITLVAQVKGSGNITLEWQKSNNISDGFSVQNLNNSNGQGINTTRLSINNVRIQDAGYYRLSAKTANETVYTSPAKVEIYESGCLSFNIPSPSIDILEGQEAKFELNIAVGEYTCRLSGSNGAQINCSGTGPKLIAKKSNALPSDSGTYYMNISDSSGNFATAGPFDLKVTPRQRASCLAKAITWGSGCQGTSTEIAHNVRGNVTNTSSGFSGSAQVLCEDGTLSVISTNSQCIADSSQPSQPPSNTFADCTTSMYGNFGNRPNDAAVCGGNLPNTIRHEETGIITNTVNGFDGKARFVCNNGSLILDTGYSEQSCQPVRYQLKTMIKSDSAGYWWGDQANATLPVPTCDSGWVAVGGGTEWVSNYYGANEAYAFLIENRIHQNGWFSKMESARFKTHTICAQLQSANGRQPEMPSIFSAPYIDSSTIKYSSSSTEEEKSTFTKYGLGQGESLSSSGTICPPFISVPLSSNFIYSKSTGEETRRHLISSWYNKPVGLWTTKTANFEHKLGVNCAKLSEPVSNYQKIAIEAKEGNEGHKNGSDSLESSASCSEGSQIVGVGIQITEAITSGSCGERYWDYSAGYDYGDWNYKVSNRAKILKMAPVGNGAVGLVECAKFKVQAICAKLVDK